MPESYVMINCQPGKEDLVLPSLTGIQGVKEAYGVFGTYDVLCRVEGKTEEDIIDTITKKIRNLSSIRATLTLPISKPEISRKLNKDELDTVKRSNSFAYVLLNCNGTKKTDTLDRIKQIPEVIEIDELNGYYYDYLCRIMAPTFSEVSKIVTNQMRKLESIKNTITLSVINEQS